MLKSLSLNKMTNPPVGRAVSEQYVTFQNK